MLLLVEELPIWRKESCDGNKNTHTFLFFFTPPKNTHQLAHPPSKIRTSPTERQTGYLLDHQRGRLVAPPNPAKSHGRCGRPPLEPVTHNPTLHPIPSPCPHGHRNAKPAPRHPGPSQQSRNKNLRTAGHLPLLTLPMSSPNNPEGVTSRDQPLELLARTRIHTIPSTGECRERDGAEGGDRTGAQQRGQGETEEMSSGGQSE
nr:PREDICTED: uncharacterized protein LOC107079287 isoform X1 [Lepisosteus oculatus]